MGEYTEDIIIKDTPIYAKNEISVNDHKKECGSCKSNNTACIFVRSEGCNMGFTFDEEYVCRDCGKYTAYLLDYDS